MAHTEQLAFVKTVSEHIAPRGYTGKAILEIGSYDVNGSIRPFFSESIYVGVDLTEGPGVDIVCEGHKVADPDETYDLTISCECFEHNPRWLETFLNMYRMTKSGGVLVFTCATRGRFEHGTARTTSLFSPGTQSLGWDYYLNLEEADFRKHLDFEPLFNTHLFLTNRHAKDLYFVGQKRGDPTIFQMNKSVLREHYINVVRRLRRLQGQKQSSWKKFKSRIESSLLGGMALVLPDRSYQNCAFQLFKLKNHLLSERRSIL
jgi:SAM-dependent methyltransferase